MQTRAEYDERLSVPIEELLDFFHDGRSLGEILQTESPNGGTYALAYLFYRCPWAYSIKMPNEEGLEKWAGPFECNSVLSAQTGWHHSQRSGKNKAKNIWQCKHCTGDWMEGRHGTRMVQIITHTWMLQLVLDDPPQKLWNKWTEMRIEYYKRREPRETFRDKRPWAPKTQKIHTLRLECKASAEMWALLLKEHIPDYNPEAIQAIDAFRIAQGSEPADAFGSLKDDPDAWAVVQGSGYTLDSALNGRLQNETIKANKTGLGKTDINSLQETRLMDIEV